QATRATARVAPTIPRIALPGPCIVGATLAVALEGRLAQVSMDKEDGHCSLAVALEGRLAQVSMDKEDGHRPLADAGGDTPDGTVPHISGGKDAGDAGLQEERFAVKRPALWRLSLAHQVATGENKAPLV